MERLVKVVLDPEVRKLCSRPYYNHPRGCPNYNENTGCPPSAPMLNEVLDLAKPVWAVWATLDFTAHRERMREKHPKWSKRQLDCCLYWQGALRKELQVKVEKFCSTMLLPLKIGIMLEVIYRPEAMGVNVTATLEGEGVTLEWPPEKIVHKVALVGILLKS